jgi:hypothetical protein
MEQGQSAGAAVDRLLDAIMEKLKANREIVAKSLPHGRLTWRKQGNGEFEIRVQPEI